MTRLLAYASLVFLALAPATRAGAQISPGPLARAHADLEGALNCVKCHGPKKSAMSASCQSCHKDIEWLTERNRGFHASREAKAKDCASCHPDHAGREFALVAWPGGSPERFDHRLAGWALDGGHLEVKCRECHTAEYRTSESARLAKRTNAAGWTGLETTCASCHAGDDVHRGALRKNCDACHDTRDWKKATRFSHDSTAYALTGKHVEVECDACHLANRLPLKKDAQGRSIPVYTPLSFRACTDCHDDPHKGRLSPRCAECHSTKGFAAIEGRTFNHGLTSYPLRGRHARVACALCHGADMAKPKPAFDRCVSCHTDPHNEGAILSGKPADCDACHRVDGFAPSTFTVARHASSPYPLEGRHAQVACVKCHTPTTRAEEASGARVARLRMPSGRCADCHADAHGGQLAKRADQGACEGCHAVAGWAPSTFSITSHATLRLGLEGRHAELPCRSCHGATRQGLPAPAGTVTALGSAGIAVTLPGARCADCHVDAHQGRYSAGGPLAAAGECATCHAATAFRPTLVTASQHERLGFALDGAHRAIACVSCHSELQARPASSTLLLSSKGVTRFPASLARRTCASCHQNPHGEQFADRKERCESCHGTEAFSPAPRFDHERTAFSLRGAHAKVACGSCHTMKDAKGARTTIYRPLSGKCESCHDRRKLS